MTVKIAISTFSGVSKVHDGTLADALRGIAQNEALRVASSIADITDNSGGTANGTMAAAADFTPSAASGSNAAAKADLETQFGNVRDGLKEILAQVNVIRAKVPAFDALVDEMGGTAADGTIGAISSALIGVAASRAAAAGSNTVLATLRDRASQLAIYVNKLVVATGGTELVDSLGGAKTYSETFAAVSTDTGAVATGADAEANAIVTVAEANARLGVLADAIADMAAKLNAITADANANPVLKTVAV